jgi:hypothetical protein
LCDDGDDIKDDDEDGGDAVMMMIDMITIVMVNAEILIVS